MVAESSERITLSVTSIQRVFRGFLGRRLYAKKMLETERDRLKLKQFRKHRDSSSNKPVNFHNASSHPEPEKDFVNFINFVEKSTSSVDSLMQFKQFEEQVQDVNHGYTKPKSLITNKKSVGESGVSMIPKLVKRKYSSKYMKQHVTAESITDSLDRHITLIRKDINAIEAAFGEDDNEDCGDDDDCVYIHNTTDAGNVEEVIVEDGDFGSSLDLLNDSLNPSREALKDGQNHFESTEDDFDDDSVDASSPRPTSNSILQNGSQKVSNSSVVAMVPSRYASKVSSQSISGDIVSGGTIRIQNNITHHKPLDGHSTTDSIQHRRDEVVSNAPKSMPLNAELVTTQSPTTKSTAVRTGGFGTTGASSSSSSPPTVHDLLTVAPPVADAGDIVSIVDVARRLSGFGRPQLGGSDRPALNMADPPGAVMPTQPSAARESQAPRKQMVSTGLGPRVVHVGEAALEGKPVDDNELYEGRDFRVGEQRAAVAPLGLNRKDGIASIRGVTKAKASVDTEEATGYSQLFKGARSEGDYSRSGGAVVDPSLRANNQMKDSSEMWFVKVEAQRQQKVSVAHAIFPPAVKKSRFKNGAENTTGGMKDGKSKSGLDMTAEEAALLRELDDLDRKQRERLEGFARYSMPASSPTNKRVAAAVSIAAAPTGDGNQLSRESFVKGVKQGVVRDATAETQPVAPQTRDMKEKLAFKPWSRDFKPIAAPAEQRGGVLQGGGSPKNSKPLRSGKTEVTGADRRHISEKTSIARENNAALVSPIDEEDEKRGEVTDIVNPSLPAYQALSQLSGYLKEFQKRALYKDNTGCSKRGRGNGLVGDDGDSSSVGLSGLSTRSDGNRSGYFRSGSAPRVGRRARDILSDVAAAREQAHAAAGVGGVFVPAYVSNKPAAGQMEETCSLPLVRNNDAINGLHKLNNGVVAASYVHPLDNAAGIGRPIRGTASSAPSRINSMPLKLPPPVKVSHDYR